MAVVYFILPFTTLIELAWLRETAMFLCWMCKTFSTTFAFPGCTILLTNTAPSIRILGPINGFTTSIGALGRAIGPSLVGYAFTWGVRTGYLVTPFWVLTVMGVIAVPPLFWAIEGDGFGGDEENDFSDAEDNPESPTHDKKGLHTAALKLQSTSLNVKNDVLTETKDNVAPLIARLQTPDAFASAVYSDTEDDAEADGLHRTHRVQRTSSPFLQPPLRFVDTRLSRTSRADSRPRTRRRSSTPLGAGVGFKRLSSNLGVTRSGYGSGSEL
jgi:hypothetical protein